MCQIHRQKAIERQALVKANKRQAGICISCSKLAVPGKKRCEWHMSETRLSNQADPEAFRLKKYADYKKRYNRRKDKAFAAYGGYVCKCCGEAERVFLSIDHINNDGAAHRRMLSGGSNSDSGQLLKWLEDNHYPPGFQILCMNCNFGRQRNNGICPHRMPKVAVTT